MICQRLGTWFNRKTRLVPRLSPRQFCHLVLEQLEHRSVPSVSRIVPLNGAVDSMSADGRFLALDSHAVTPIVVSTSLSLYDQQIGNSTTLSGGGPVSNEAVVSADGQFTAFVSGPSGPSSTNAGNVYLFDSSADSTTLVSHAAGSTTVQTSGFDPSISADGRFVAFESSETNLVPGQAGANTASEANVFLYDRQSGTTSLVSHVSGSDTTTANADSVGAVISADGNSVVFESAASDLVADQAGPNTVASVFLYDRLTQTVTLVNHVSGSALTTPSPPNAQVFPLSISSDGRFIAYISSATDMVSGQAGNAGQGNLFLYDRMAGANVLVSHNASSAASVGNGASSYPVVSADGTTVVFESTSTDLLAGQTPGGNNLFAYTMATGKTTLASLTIGAGQVATIEPAVSMDGGLMAFVCTIGTTSDQEVVLYRGSTQTEQIIFQQSASTTPGPATPEPGQISSVTITQNGNFVAFSGLWRAPMNTQGPIEYTGGWLWNVPATAPTTSLVGCDAATGHWWISKSTGTSFQTSVADAWSPNVTWINVQTGDFTGDGTSDIIGMVQQTGQWFVSVPDSQGHFTTRLWDAWSPDCTWTVCIGDVNGDGKDDIVGYAQQTGQWFVGLSTGSSFTTALWDAWNPNIVWTNMMVGDVTGNGKADIMAYAKNTGQWWVGLSNGSAFHPTLWDVWNSNVTWVNVQLGDFNGDGRMDLVGRAEQYGQWWVGLSTGTSFKTTLWDAWSTGVTWTGVMVGDFNGDGKADIIGRALQTGQWWVGESTGAAFQSSVWDVWSTGVTWVDVQVGDFNGDGRSDIAGMAEQTGQWYVGVSLGQVGDINSEFPGRTPTGLQSSGGFKTRLWDAWNPSIAWSNVKTLKLG